MRTVCLLTNTHGVPAVCNAPCTMLGTEQAKLPVLGEFISHVKGQMCIYKTSAGYGGKNGGLKREQKVLEWLV